MGLLPSDLEWIGLEPNEHMHPLLLQKAEDMGFAADLRQGDGKAIPLEDNSVDAVLSTLVLCSVQELPKLLAEVRRVLRPGGRYFFWEHVLAPKGQWLRGFQHLMTPIHRFCADGCRANRDLGAELRAFPFEALEIEEFRVPSQAAPAWIRPHIAGVATI